MPNPETDFSRAKHRAFELFRRAAAPVKHFTPVSFHEGAHRDRFGNKLIASPSLAYLDRDEHPVKAAALVSKEGEDFLRRNKGLLKPMEQAIVENEIADLKGRKGIHLLELPGGRFLRRIYDQDGNQSKIYLLETEEDKVVVKKIQPVPVFYGELNNQPYFNEMLQVQSITHDLGEDLADVGVSMSTFLFATGQVSGIEYAEGSCPDYTKVRKRLLVALKTAKSYVAEQASSGNPIWENVYVDEQVRIDGDSSNFIQGQDGHIVWVDPFVYVPSK